MTIIIALLCGQNKSSKKCIFSPVGFSPSWKCDQLLRVRTTMLARRDLGEGGSIARPSWPGRHGRPTGARSPVPSIPNPNRNLNLNPVCHCSIRRGARIIATPPNRVEENPPAAPFRGGFRARSIHHAFNTLRSSRMPYPSPKPLEHLINYRASGYPQRPLECRTIDFRESKHTQPET